MHRSFLKIEIRKLYEMFAQISMQESVTCGVQLDVSLLCGQFKD